MSFHRQRENVSAPEECLAQTRLPGQHHGSNRREESECAEDGYLRTLPLALDAELTPLSVKTDAVRSKSQRVAFIDVTKGIAISLVVLGHVLGGALARGWVVPADAGETVYKFIYAFHMPVFFIISGAFAIGHIRRAPFHAFLSRCGSIAWPYLLWGTIFIALQTFIAGFMLFPPQAGALYSVERLLLGETSWFLWTLFVCEVLLILAVIIPLWVLMAVSLVMSLALPAGYPGIFGNVVHFMPYLVLGALVGHRIREISFASPWKALCGGLLIFAALFAATATGAGSGDAIGFLEGVSGTAALLLLAYGLNRISGRAGDILREIGEASLVVFLLHPYFQVAARIIIEHLVGKTLPLQLVIPTVAGILGPTLIWMMVERSNAQWLFRLPVGKERGRLVKLQSDAAGH